MALNRSCRIRAGRERSGHTRRHMPSSADARGLSLIAKRRVMHVDARRVEFIVVAPDIEEIAAESA